MQPEFPGGGLHTPKGRNFTKLAGLNALNGLDERITYEDTEHRYTVDGATVPRSVTSVVKKVVDESDFNPDLVIAQNLASWRRNPRSKYATAISGLSDTDASLKVKKSWSDANRLGTALHRRLEGLLNDEDLPLDGETDAEWPGLVRAVEDFKQLGAFPFRTELSVFWRRSSDGQVVCAGQLDALLKCGGDGNDASEFIMLDLKRTDKLLSPDVLPYEGRRCLPPLDRQHANEHTKYSLQMSMYCVMLTQCTGIHVPPQNRFLLRSHPSMPKAELVACSCFDMEAEQILDSL